MAAAHYQTVSIFNAAGENEVLCTVNVDAGEYGVLSVSFSPKGDMVAAGCYNGKIHFVDPIAGEIKSSLSVDGEVWSVDWSPLWHKLSAACNRNCSYSVKIFRKEGSTGNLVCQ